MSLTRLSVQLRAARRSGPCRSPVYPPNDSFDRFRPLNDICVLANARGEYLLTPAAMKCNSVCKQEVFEWQLAVRRGGKKVTFIFSPAREFSELNIRFSAWLFFVIGYESPTEPDIDSLSPSTNEQIGFYTAEQFDAFQ